MVAPKLDGRSAEQIFAQAIDLARVYIPAWQGFPDPAKLGDSGDPAFQLLRAFSRLMEILLERLNKVPEKNFLAFLDAVGVEASPGAPASVPITFLPSPKAPEGGLVPAGTQVATTQTDKADAEVFETRRPIYVTASKLAAVINLLPGSERFSGIPLTKLPPKLDVAGSDAASVESVVLSDTAPGLAAVPHVLYLGSSHLFGKKETVDVTLTLRVSSGDASLLSGGHLVWSKLDKNSKKSVPLSASYSLDLSGGVRVVLSSFGDADKSTIAGVEDVWISCAFVGLLPPAVARPQLASITGTLSPAGAAVSATEAPSHAFAGSTPIDLSRPFKPFGDRPRFGDALYLSASHAFAEDVDTITIHADLKPYLTATLQSIFGGLSTETAALVTVRTEVTWEYFNRDGTWQPLVEFTHELSASDSVPPALPTITRSRSSVPAAKPGEEGTFFGLADASSAAFSFQRPADMATVKVNGTDGLWIRAQLTSDDPYGRDAFLLPGTQLTVVQSTLLPPVLKKLSLSFTYKVVATPIDHVVTDNNFLQTDHSPGGPANTYPLEPFVPLSEALLPGSKVIAFAADPAVYMGFDQPFGDVYISLYVKLRDIVPSVDRPAEQGQPRVTWEYLAPGPRWRALDVEDETGDLTSSGTVSFLSPGDFLRTGLLGAPALPGSPELCWLRARLAGGLYDYPPAVEGIFLNTVMADNRQTFRGDVVIGSGSGEPNQGVTLLKVPVLSGDLWVREPEPPPQVELSQLLSELRSDAGGTAVAAPVESVADILDIREPTASRPNNIATPLPSREVWVRWRRVPNFLGSGPRSRHYALDPLSGLLVLGDGKLQGLLPPLAKDNLVIRNYRTGGGEAAARVAVPLAIKELKSSLPYVEKVFNVEAAVGGSSPWDVPKILQFGPQLLKNKGRAVSAEDFEWMVLQQFSQVARVKCLSTRAPGPSGLVMKPGALTVVVVPRGVEREPRPSRALLRQIVDFLTRQCLGGIVADVHALGPGFFPIGVQARIHARDPGESSEVERRALRALEGFFHPLTGGEQKTGWPFGREVQVSEVFAVLQRVDGVDYVASVELAKATGSKAIGNNDLLSSGSHIIEMI